MRADVLVRVVAPTERVAEQEFEPPTIANIVKRDEPVRQVRGGYSGDPVHKGAALRVPVVHFKTRRT